MPSNKRVRKKYSETSLNAVNSVDADYIKVVLAYKDKVSTELRRNKDKILARPQPRITFAPRFPNLRQEHGVLSYIRAHIREVQLGVKVNTPQFADPSQHLVRAGE